MARHLVGELERRHPVVVLLGMSSPSGSLYFGDDIG